MKATLPTNYQDDILNVSTEGKRKYRMNYNDDGTVSFVDVTPYDQEGSDFGAGDINATNQAVNESFDKNKLIRDMDAINALTEEGYAPDALALKDVNDSLGGLKFGTDGEGNYGYFGDDDILIPFKSAEFITALLTSQTYETIKDCIIVGFATSTSSATGAINLATVSVSGGELTELYRKTFTSSSGGYYSGALVWSLKTNGETVTITCGTGNYAQAIIIG